MDQLDRTDQDGLVGTLFAGRFHIEGVLGAGGMGTVYLARHNVLQRHFAIKLIRRQMLSEDGVARFRREARAASRVEHPHILSVFDFGQLADGSPYLVMEYLVGESLATVLRREKQLPLRRSLRIMAQIAEALAEAHARDVVHRDLKPENVLLGEHPKPDFVKLLDFGLAKILGIPPTNLSLGGQTLGTPWYMAPEQCFSSQIDHRSDIYSLGVVAFEMLVGRVPFEGAVVETMHAHLERQPPRLAQAAGRDDIPEEVEELIQRCLAKDPADRPPSAGILLRQVRRLLAHFTDEMGQAAVQAIAQAGLLGRASAALRQPLTDIEVDTLPPLFPPSGEVEIPETTEVPAMVEISRTSALSELTCALRDHGVGSPELSRRLAAMIHAEDPVVVLESRVNLLEAQLTEAEALARDREARLRQALSQLEHERNQLIAGLPDEHSFDETLTDFASPPEIDRQLESLENDILAIADGIGRVSRQFDAERSELRDNLASARESLELRRRALVRRQDLLAELVGQIVRSEVAVDPELQRLLDIAEGPGLSQPSATS